MQQTLSSNRARTVVEVDIVGLKFKKCKYIMPKCWRQCFVKLSGGHRLSRSLRGGHACKRRSRMSYELAPTPDSLITFSCYPKPHGSYLILYRHLYLTPSHCTQLVFRFHTPSMASAFFYGTLMHPKILKRVIGHDGSYLQIRPALLLVSARRLPLT